MPKEFVNYSYNLEYRFRDKSGSWRYMESTMTYFENELLAISRDIAERKRVEEELKRQAERLEELIGERTRELKEAERLAAIGELATMVGHDLRNPLQGISGAAYVLRTKLRTTRDEQVRTMLEIIEKDVRYSDKIINDLLDYSREMRLELTAISLSSVIEDALASVLVPETISLKLSEKEAKINVDPEKIKRVFMNIIKNAVDAMPGGGTFTIQSKESNDNMEIAFNDTGTGMPKEVMEKLGKPLQTTKAKGMGMGLAICYRIIQPHKGSVTAESIPDQGTTIKVTLPLLNNETT
ncbi:ATP-binding protein [Candidatus Bathyarchaeota archaeon]|jgi:signal transduction histidine kinase|nr:ATP-binding protein [Candidatus Bathyarchaeota archaeon]